MTSRPRLLDLYAGGGGAGAGYQAVGFHVTAVEISDHLAQNNPADVMVKADALAVLRGETDVDLSTFQVIHASPPCPRYSRNTPSHTRDTHPDHVPEVIDLLRAWRARGPHREWIVENVPGAPLPDPVMVCGSFLHAWDPDLNRTVRLARHRLFSCSVGLMVHPCGCDRSTRVATVMGNGGRSTPESTGMNAYLPHLSVRRALMGTPWMNRKQVSNAIPPAYTQALGEQILDALRADGWTPDQ